MEDTTAFYNNELVCHDSRLNNRIGPAMVIRATTLCKTKTRVAGSGYQLLQSACL